MSQLKNNLRPEASARKFSSSAIEQIIEEITSAVSDPGLSFLFNNCFPNTLDTTVSFNVKEGKPDTFVITGDIDAMCLRDSSAQVFPYLKFVNKDANLKELIKGVINRQTRQILSDPYANAFYDSPKESPWKDDLTEMKPFLHERKWELDSLCYPVRLAYNYWKITSDISCFDEEWKNASMLILKTFIEQQRKTGKGNYRFGRVTAWSTDTIPGNGYGNPAKPVGLIASVFRPSDDASVYLYNIPSNFFAALSLLQISEIFKIVYRDEETAPRFVNLSFEVLNAIYKYGTGDKRGYGKIFAFEADGFGNQLFMDDANIPGLLSLPYLGCLSANDEIYMNTRKFVLSENNPYYFRGRAAEGIGSPHTLENNIWPVGIITRAYTSNDDDEIIKCLGYLRDTHLSAGFMHESFNKDNPSDYTRSWFAWANSFFGELIIKLYYEKPWILKNLT